MLNAILWLMLYPLRVFFSGVYWVRFRLGGSTRARMASIELDNRQLWERNFSLEQRLSVLEAHEAERKQAVMIEHVLSKFPEKG